MEAPGHHLDPLKVLLIEDEKRISDFVTKGLKEHGFTFDLAENGDDGFYLATTQIYDAIVLDSILPGRDGLSILKGLRAKGKKETGRKLSLIHISEPTRLLSIAFALVWV